MRFFLTFQPGSLVKPLGFLPVATLLAVTAFMPLSGAELRTGPQTWQTGATVRARFASTTIYDRFTIAGPLTLDLGTTVIVSGDVPDLNPGLPFVWTLFTATTVTGPIPALDATALAVSSGSFSLSSSPTALSLIYTPSLYAVWQTLHAIPVGSPPDADPDRDGLGNLLEYALGGSSVTATSRPAPAVGVDTVRGTFLTLTFFRARAEVRYVVQGSDDLLTWTDLASDPGDVGRSVTFTDVTELSFVRPARRYLRLKVSLP